MIAHARSNEGKRMVVRKLITEDCMHLRCNYHSGYELIRITFGFANIHALVLLVRRPFPRRLLLLFFFPSFFGSSSIIIILLLRYHDLIIMRVHQRVLFEFWVYEFHSGAREG